MIYVAFAEEIENSHRTIYIFTLKNFKEFSNWLACVEPKELYVSDNREDILKYIDRMVD